MMRGCVGGPRAGRRVDDALGERWPYVLAFTATQLMVGYYHYDCVTETYQWWDQPAETLTRSLRP